MGTKGWSHKSNGGAIHRTVSQPDGFQRADRARSLLFRYTDKEFSFTDCTSFTVMKELRLRKVLTLRPPLFADVL
jgi:predicted nucleic acid-binding protein